MPKVASLKWESPSCMMCGSLLLESSGLRHVLTPVMSGSPRDEKVALQTTHGQVGHCRLGKREKHERGTSFQSPRCAVARSALVPSPSGPVPPAAHRPQKETAVASSPSLLASSPY
ncbi:unnamed protein product [Pleuronectes platessa]|uniref:Uncharacterized protein n=1 Tax=Pleuronectes platessa TaxID=8262 RepID=A0A9N7U2J8_PLEPL|nr:unnamed protein product [Pleuronectes platessa]